MTEAPDLPRAAGQCRTCSTLLVPGARYCGKCGAPTPVQRAAGGDPAPMVSGRPRRAAPAAPAPAAPPPKPSRALAVLLVLALVALAVAAALAYLSQRSQLADERQARDEAVAALQQRLADSDRERAALARRVAALEVAAATSDKGIAPLAARVLKSVYTIEVGDGSGTAWVAWKDGTTTYLITANHVVEGYDAATVHRGGKKWPAGVVRTDDVNDLALVRVDASLGPELWPLGRIKPTPKVGEELILVGSPYGLEGTVTSGVVSRVTYNRVQTDAAANPGNSGGPAVDKEGRVVGILVEGGGENLNFAIPIARACVKIRRC